MEDYFEPKIKIDTTIKDGVITQTCKSNLVNSVVKHIADTKEAQIRKALITLGWTPPKDDGYCKVCGIHPAVNDGECYDCCH